MGISQHLHVVSDAEIDTFRREPAAVERWFDAKRLESPAPDVVSLHEHWRAVEALIAGATGTFTALSEGDVAFPTAAHRGAHVLSSAAVKRLAPALRTVTREHIERYARRSWAEFANRTGRSPEMTPAQLAASTDELSWYVDRLRQIWDEAEAAGSGLLFSLWEDW